MTEYFGARADVYIVKARVVSALLLELAIRLEEVEVQKTLALKENRLEDAAKYREEEIDIMKEINKIIKDI